MGTLPGGTVLIFMGGGGPGGASPESDDEADGAWFGGLVGFVPGGGVFISGAAGGGGWEVEGASGILGCCWAVAGAKARENKRIASPAKFRIAVIGCPTDTPPQFGVYFLFRMLIPAVCCI